jgi:hypothetical protein
MEGRSERAASAGMYVLPLSLLTHLCRLPTRSSDGLRCSHPADKAASIDSGQDRHGRQVAVKTLHILSQERESGK